ncbi:hypothetical protein IAT38_007235 [Cryptococcus sp. DSM 104549]
MSAPSDIAFELSDDTYSDIIIKLSDDSSSDTSSLDHSEESSSSLFTSEHPRRIIEHHRHNWLASPGLYIIASRDRSESIPLFLSRRTDMFANDSRHNLYYGDVSITPVVIQDAESLFLQEFSRESGEDYMRFVLFLDRLWEVSHISVVKIVSAHQRQYPEYFLRACVFMMTRGPLLFFQHFDDLFNINCLEDVGSTERASAPVIMDHEGIINLLIAFLNMDGKLNPIHPPPLISPDNTDLDYNRVQDHWRLSAAEEVSTDLFSNLAMRLSFVQRGSPTFAALYACVINIFAGQLHKDMAYVQAWPSLLDETYTEKEEMSGVDHRGVISAAALFIRKANRVDKIAHLM